MPPGESSVTVYRWPFPSANKLQSFSLWQIGSAIVIPAVGILSKIMTGWLNTVKVHNREVLIDALDNRPAGTPLITVSNHHSCLDDPMLWGILDWRHILNSRVMRWTAAAHDICFTNDWHAQFFALGKTFPVVRGDGVYQKAMDFCLERLNSGAWVHFFPEGKVNMAKNEFIRLKWGIGRLIAECKICPIVIPFWHLGMDSVLPNVEPYMPRIGQTVTILFGKPVDFSALREKLWSEMKTAKHFSGYATDPHWHGITICVNDWMSSYPCTCQAMCLSTCERDYSVTLPRNQMEQRKIITDKLQDELFQLKSQAEILHFGGSG